jgi:hypothetical protein
MKLKIVTVILLCAIATLSFASFTSKPNDSKKVAVQNTQDKSSEPAGGLAIEDKF